MIRLFLLIVLLFPCFAQAQTIVPNTKIPVNITYLDDTGIIISEKFESPAVIFDGNRHVDFIDASPIDPSRKIENIPTFGLAIWHHWLFSQQLFRSQREYADCVGGIKILQKLLNEKPLIDEGSIKDIVLNIREYIVPFEPIQNMFSEDLDYSLPATREDAINHIEAAIASVNVTVFHVGLCRQTLASYERRVRAKLK